jgi:hypothetical protein
MGERQIGDAGFLGQPATSFRTSAIALARELFLERRYVDFRREIEVQCRAWIVSRGVVYE